MLWGDCESVSSTGSEETSSTPPLPRSHSPAEEDWVLVGPSPPAPGDLQAGLQPLSPPSSTPSEVAEVEGEPAGPTSVNRGRQTHPPTSRLDALAAKEAKSNKSAQLVKQRNSGKTLSSKAIKRSNKSLLAEAGKRGVARANFPIKMAGTNKNLKQC